MENELNFAPFPTGRTSVDTGTARVEAPRSSEKLPQASFEAVVADAFRELSEWGKSVIAAGAEWTQSISDLGKRLGQAAASGAQKGADMLASVMSDIAAIAKKSGVALTQGLGKAMSNAGSFLESVGKTAPPQHSERNGTENEDALAGPRPGDLTGKETVDQLNERIDDLSDQLDKAKATGDREATRSIENQIDEATALRDDKQSPGKFDPGTPQASDQGGPPPRLTPEERDRLIEEEKKRQGGKMPKLGEAPGEKKRENKKKAKRKKQGPGVTRDEGGRFAPGGSGKKDSKSNNRATAKERVSMSVRAPGGYKATQTKDELIVHRVPIFCECSRTHKGERLVFGKKWLEAAVETARQAEAEGYLPPLHVRHHEPGTESSVRAAGVFRIVGIQTIRMKGKPRLAVFADLIFRDPEVIDEVLRKRLPYRSVEIFDVAKPNLNGLALLDHEAPFLELPMLEVSEVLKADQPCVAGATFGRPWALETFGDARPMVACFSRGSAAHWLFRDEDDMDEPEDAKAEKDEDDSVNMMDEDGGLDVDSVIAAIEDGSISIGKMDALVAAVEARKAAMGATEPEAEEVIEEELAPAPAPTQQAMKAVDDDVAKKMASLQGRIDGLEALQKQREEEARCTADVAEAMKQFEGKPAGDLVELESKLLAFRQKHGTEAFQDYVDGRLSTLGNLPTGAARDAAFRSQDVDLPSVALKYQQQGPDAVEQAAVFAAEYRQLAETGHARWSEEQYVEANMQRLSMSRLN